VRAFALLLAASLALPSPSVAAMLGRAAVPQVRPAASAPAVRVSLPLSSPSLSLSAPALSPSLAALAAAPSLAPSAALAAPAALLAAPSASPLASPLAAPLAAAPAASPLASLLSAPADAPKADEGPEASRERAGARFDASAPREEGDGVAGAPSAPQPLAAAGPGAPAPKAAPPSFSSRPGFKPLTRTHFLGVFNDTALKTLFMVWVTAVIGGDLANLYIGAATAAFTLPYVILSSYAGPLADRVENRKLIRLLKALEVGIVAAASALFWYAQVSGPNATVLTGLVLTLGAMGTHSAFLSPAKERMLSKLVPEKELGAATARYNLNTFTGIVMGMLAGTVLEALTGSIGLAAVSLLGVAGLGYWVSRKLAQAPVTGVAPESVPRELLSYLRNLKGTLAADWRAVQALRPVRLVVMGLTWYWFIGSIGQINMPGFVTQTLGLDELWLSAFLGTLTLGVGLGATAAEKLQKNGVRLDLAVWGALTMAGFLFALGLLGPAAGLVLAFVAAAGLGAGSGLFNVPLNAQLLAVTPAESRGRYLGAANFVIFAGLALSAVAFALFPASNLLFAWLGLSWHLGPQAVFLVMGVVALVLAGRTRRDLPGMKP
jgi:MFS family permease